MWSLLLELFLKEKEIVVRSCTVPGTIFDGLFLSLNEADVNYYGRWKLIGLLGVHFLIFSQTNSNRESQFDVYKIAT
jgi:hypothetical protein